MIRYNVKPKEDVRREFAVYQVHLLNYGDGWMGEKQEDSIQEYRTYIGNAWAVSPAQAEAFVAHREGINRDEWVDWAYDGYRHSYLEAVEA